ncbi:hypothetical protein H4R33_004810 [Dimargaris cristalligena]|uniref:Mss4-like protein n=1 Tax=Dimargaris cristalligena TaxID=215637 RepID=A0A4P9ZUU5_9FUNG|nr:hypothetical protein H4R33_004810 [Dimargaris cristalligena]RKP37354.1 Mss4-like protein [Dimargaris cristalligena]|eukprot:RKP37354.1 Mss4-like protein [Dimargaris cristalligena]
MELTGSCHCGQVQFTVTSHTPVPYMKCHCSICRKLQGGDGASINIMGIASTFRVTRGSKTAKAYVAAPEQRDPTSGKVTRAAGATRNFCGECGSHLWAFDERWAENIYPFASAIDTKLPVPTRMCHIMLGSAAEWSDPRQAVYQDPAHQADTFENYPELSIADWHQKYHCTK